MSGGAPIPFIDLGRAFQAIRDDVRAALDSVLDSQRFILGPEGEALEAEMAARIGNVEAVGVASGTDALLLSYRALDLAPDEEVLTSPFSFFASAGAVMNAGGRPAFADIDPVTFNLDPAAAAAAVTRRTRVVCPVHLYGLAADVARLRAALSDEVFILEDAAQALGAAVGGVPAGRLGDAAAYSFFPTKNLGGLGDAGMVVSTDGAFAAKVRRLRHHGQTGAYEHELLGTNSRLDEMQAAALRVKLRQVDHWNAQRRQNAARLTELLAASEIPVRREGGRLDGADLSLPVTPKGFTHAWNVYTVRARHRDDLQRHLSQAGIGSAVYYPLPLHLQPCFRELGYADGRFPEAEAACREVLALPTFPGITSAELERVAAAVAAFYRSRS